MIINSFLPKHDEDIMNVASIQNTRTWSYIIVYAWDHCDMSITRAVPSTDDWWINHHMVWSTMSICIVPESCNKRSNYGRCSILSAWMTWLKLIICRNNLTSLMILTPDDLWEIIKKDIHGHVLMSSSVCFPGDNYQRHIFVSLLVVPGHSPACVLCYAVDCLRWGRGGWGLHLDWPQQRYLGAFWGSSSGNPGIWSLNGSQSMAQAIKALVWGCIHWNYVCHTTFFCHIYFYIRVNVPVPKKHVVLQISSIVSTFTCSVWSFSAAHEFAVPETVHTHSWGHAP